jgi:hypothetical protein
LLAVCCHFYFGPARKRGLFSGLPRWVFLSVCGDLFGLRRIAYKTDQVWAESWNANRNALWNEEILQGQRSAWLIASGVITQSGSRTDKILSAIQSSSPIIQVQKQEKACIRHSKLSGFEELQSTKFSEAIKTLITQIEPVLAKNPIRHYLSTDS